MGGRNVRIGDADREAAINLLAEHMSAGRLDIAEYDERCAKAAASRVHADLAALFTDLPAPAPAAPAPAAPAHRFGGLPMAALGALAVVLLAAAVFRPVLLVVLAVLLAGMVLLRRR